MNLCFKVRLILVLGVLITKNNQHWALLGISCSISPDTDTLRWLSQTLLIAIEQQQGTPDSLVMQYTSHLLHPAATSHTNAARLCSHDRRFPR